MAKGVPQMELWQQLQGVSSEKLGGGASGSVYLVNFKGKLACMKVGKDQDHKENYAQEGLILQKLSGVGGAPHLLATSSDSPLLIMTHCSGSPLDKIIHENQLSLWEWVKIFSSIAKNLADIHSQDVVHNNIKPDNIMLEINKSGDFITSIIDFGLSSPPGLADSFHEDPAESHSRFPYYAPEVYLQRLSSGRGNVYSLGHLMRVVVTRLEKSNAIPSSTRALDSLISIMTRQDWTERPSMRWVANLLNLRVQRLGQALLEGLDVLQEADCDEKYHREADEPQDTTVKNALVAYALTRLSL